ncbi:hypothetical protein DFR70_11342 [Nocardia tenerifensis]|uniref:Glycosyl hydrolase family 17 n=1 Tax=Nocardia tenerifensis TaxID=228006 RepID=A0A318JXR4_9NOCA|nr:hypothetical protein [Nocardia tenerifensis]PXX58707.1 hypothetical protein DFR70_11342 [Nocardia tenerifensis]
MRRSRSVGVVAADLVDFRPFDCPPEDPASTLAALRELQGDASAFYVRCYRHFGVGMQRWPGISRTPARPEWYAGNGRLIDLVACYQSPEPDPSGFAEFVREAVRDVAGWGGGKVQVGEELNMPAPQDGGSPGCFDAIAAGIAAALEERERLGVAVEIGVNSAGMADPVFWQRMADAVGATRLAALDYIGLDAFPDVFHRIPHDQLAGSVGYLLERFRSVTTDAGVPASTPIHITETGWPTGADRGEETQRVVLETVANAVFDADLGITAYEFFGLRDGRSDGEWTSRFGLLRDDYTPKPAFPAICDLIGSRSTPNGRSTV